MRRGKNTAAKEWAMPDWMRPYAPHITNTGDNGKDRVAVVERMYNGNADPFINLPLSTLQACVKSQVAMLYRLHEVGRAGLYLVVSSDPHRDEKYKLFTEDTAAIREAQEEVKLLAGRHRKVVDKLTSNMVRDGWMFYQTIGEDGMSVLVLPIEVSP